ncbi:MAG: hypothetical protein B6241_05505 [Spirochaetaceae bacterium 4572_59]|nr:MAG: hypothetical protein B6241_05505 [Spirochaetaceae bacterium 4572_59]
MIFDEKELLKYTEEDSELSSELLQMAYQDIPEFLNRAIVEREQAQYVISSEYLHKIKGIAACIGAISIFSLSTEMEMQIKSVENGSFFDAHIEKISEAVSCFFLDPAVLKYLIPSDV